jgi:YidC/Oxa1 family membrane protein insertase
MWDAIREFLGAVVSFFYGLIPNLGVAIILLTVAVGLVLFPLTLKQTRSMRAMQLLQPEIKRLQKEYAGDKPALQQATLALYKERGVNPAAGCLPLLLQMPVWFALFQVLQSFSASPASLNDTCVGQQPSVAAGAPFTCSYEGFVAATEAGSVNRVTVGVKDATSQSVTRTDTAQVRLGDVMPAVAVVVRPAAGSVPQGGGQVEFSVQVVNGGEQAVTLEGLTDDVYGDLLAAGNTEISAGTCAAQDRTVPAGGSYACSFQGFVAGGTTAHQSTTTASLRDGAGRASQRSDTVEVGLGEVASRVAVTVRPEKGAVPSGGGLVRFVVEVSNGGSEAVTVSGLVDDRFGNLTAPGSNPTRFLTMVPNGRLHNDIQEWLEAGRQPASPAWRQFAWMNLSITPRDAWSLGFVSFIPYLITLLVVMGTAYYQQKQTTPKPKDGQPAAQQPGQAILKIFPVLFGFISYTLPAGLGVYFGASSVFRIGQQYMIIRMGERRGDGKAKSAAEEAPMEVEAKALKAADPRVKAPERPARASAVQPKTGRPVATARSPQASQQRGKKRRRR